jgi:hypothetical protein
MRASLHSPLQALLVLVALSGLSWSAHAAPSTQPAGQIAVEADPRVDAAVAAGLMYLSQQQNADGSWEGGGPRVAMTGLSLMAYLAGGHTPDVGRHGLVVRRAMDRLVELTPEDGYFGKLDGSKMYGQGIATLALIEAIGVEPDPARRKRLRAAAERALNVILNAQDVHKASDNEAGGWRYEPQSSDSDLSLTAWCILSLRAAQNVGMNVPKQRTVRASLYVQRCFSDRDGGFGYQPRNPASPAMTGVGIVALHLLEATSDSQTQPQLRAAIRFLMDHPPEEQTIFPYYTMYYTTQAAYQAGDEAWRSIWQANRDQLLSLQTPDGSWPQSHSGEEPGKIYATSMAVLTLSVPYRLLPVYQK